MKWFQLDSDTPNDPKVKATIRRGLVSGNPGQAAAGALLLLWCYVANHGSGLPGEGVDGDGNPLPLDEMADECLFDTTADLRTFLDFLAEKKHLDPDLWRDRGIVHLPAMQRRADAYAKSKGRKLAGGGRTGEDVDRPGKKSPAPTPTVQTGQDKTEPTGQDTPAEPAQPTLIPDQDMGPTPADLVRVWNQYRTQGPKVQQVTDQRAAQYRKALKAEPSLAKWQAVIQWIDGQKWTNAPGTGDHPNWRLDLDFLTKAGKLPQYFERMSADTGRPAVSGGRVAPTPGKYAEHDDGGDDDGEPTPEPTTR